MEKELVFAINYALKKGVQIHPNALKVLERVDINDLQQLQTGSNYRQPTEAIAGQNLVDIIEIMQEGLGWGDGWKEVNGQYTNTPRQTWNGVTRVHNPRSFAVGTLECIKSIWSADPSMDICLGALVHNKPEQIDLVNDEFQQLTGYTLQTYPRPGTGKLILQFHNYIRNSQRTHADSPENHDLKLAKWDSFNMPFIVGEFGSDTVSNNTNLFTPSLIKA